MRFLSRFLITFLILVIILYGLGLWSQGTEIFKHNFAWVVPAFSALVALIASVPILFKKNKESAGKTGLRGILIALGLLVGLFIVLSAIDSFTDMDKNERIQLYIFSYLGLLIAIYIFGIRYQKWMQRRRESNVQQSMSTDHGSAEWSTPEEWLRYNNPQHAQDGLWIGNGFFRPLSGHLFTVAPPGAGKGTCLIVPNLLVKPYGSYVVIDPKGENACITARAQKFSGQHVFILDPWNEQGQIRATHGIPASGFNPIDFLKLNMAELPDTCEMIAYYLLPISKSHEQFWEDRARSFIKNLLIHIITFHPPEEHNFWTLYKLVRNDTESLAKLLVNMEKNTAYDGMVQAFAREIKGMFYAQETFAGVISHVHNGTRIFESTQLRQNLSTSDFHPEKLSDGNVTVYIVIPERYMTSHAGWLRMVIGLCLKAVNARPNKRVNFLLDEFAVVGKLEDVQRAYAYGRGQNIVCWAFMQNLAQLHELYGEPGMNVFISNTALLQAFALRDNFSKDYISKALGDSTIIKKTFGEQVTFTSSGRPLLTPEEVGKDPNILCIGDSIKFRIPRVPYYNKQNEWGKYFDKMADTPPRIH